MARQEIDKSGARSKLKPRREPYWGAPIERGLYLGFRKISSAEGTWIARLHDEEGRHRYRSLGHASPTLTYDAAREAAIAWRKSVAAGIRTDEVRTVADACRAYVEERARAKGAATAHDAEMRFRRTVYGHPIGSVKLAALRQRRIEAWRDGLVEPASPDVRPLSKASANRTLTALKAALNAAVARRHIGAEKAVEWSLVKPYAGAGKRRDLYLDLGQRRALLEASQGAVRDLIEAAMLTGARAGELTNAKRSQFDHRTDALTLSGKTGTRTVPLAPAAVELFKRLSRDKLPSAPLLVRDDGRPWAHSDWDELVRDAAARANLPPGTCLYTLRHSWITAAILGGMTPLEVARLVGTSLAMIDKHYGHLATTAARERLAMVDFA